MTHSTDTPTPYKVQQFFATGGIGWAQYRTLREARQDFKVLVTNARRIAAEHKAGSMLHCASINCVQLRRDSVTLQEWTL